MIGGIFIDVNIKDIRIVSNNLCKENLNTHIIITLVITAFTMSFQGIFHIGHSYSVYPVSKESIYFMLQHFLISYIISTSMRNHEYSAKEVFKEFLSKIVQVVFTGLVVSLLSFGLIFVINQLSQTLSILLSYFVASFGMEYVGNIIEFIAVTGFYLFSIIVYSLIPVLSACILSNDTEHKLNAFSIFIESEILVNKRLIEYVVYFISSKLIIYSVLSYIVEYYMGNLPIFLLIILYPISIMLEIYAEIYILNFFMHIGDKHVYNIPIDTIMKFNHTKHEIDILFKKKFGQVGLKSLSLTLIYTLAFMIIKSLLLDVFKYNELIQEIIKVMLDVIQFGLILRAINKSMKYPDYNTKEIVTMNIKSVLYIIPVSLFVGITSVLFFRPLLDYFNKQLILFEGILESPVFMIIGVAVWVFIMYTMIIISEMVIISIYGIEIYRHDELNPIKELIKSNEMLTGKKINFFKFMVAHVCDIILCISILQFLSTIILPGDIAKVVEYSIFILKAVFIAKSALGILIFIPESMDNYVSNSN